MARKISHCYLLLLVALMAPFTQSCIKHVDNATTFHIQGFIVDKTTDKPLGSVKVGFIDTGFDYVRAEKRIRKEIGTSDDQGRVDLTFSYWWGRNEWLFFSEPRKTFDLEFSRESYRSKRIQLSAATFQGEDGKIEVILNKITMEHD